MSHESFCAGWQTWVNGLHSRMFGRLTRLSLTLQSVRRPNILPFHPVVIWDFRLPPPPRVALRQVGKRKSQITTKAHLYIAERCVHKQLMRIVASDSEITTPFGGAASILATKEFLHQRKCFRDLLIFPLITR